MRAARHSASRSTAAFPGFRLRPGFVSYTKDVDLMDRHNVQFHLYADDTQFLNCCRSTDTTSLQARLSSCASDIELWCTSRRLQLNASKTEAIWFGSKPNPSQTQQHWLLYPSRHLDVLLPPTLLVPDSRLHLEEVTTQLVCALVISRLDYCNSLLAGLPVCTTEPLQRVQNAAARLIFELSLSGTSHQAYSSYIGYPYAGASSLNYVALCTQLSPDAIQRIWRASCKQLHSCICRLILTTVLIPFLCWLLYCTYGLGIVIGALEMYDDDDDDDDDSWYNQA